MELIEEFLTIEERFGLNEIQINNQKFWNYCRFNIYSYLKTSKNGLLAAHEKLSVGKQIERYLKNTPFLLKQKIDDVMCKSQKTHQKILVLCHPRRIFVDGNMVSIYTDPIMDGIDNVVSYETTDLYSHHRPCASQNMHYLDKAEVIARLKYVCDKFIFKGRYSKLYNTLNEKLYLPLNALEECIDTEIDKELIIHIAIKYYYLACEIEKYWKREFKRQQPSAVIEVVGYGLAAMTLNTVAHSYKCPVIELQHGTINESHIGYHYLSTDGLDTLPDVFFTFGDYWNDQISMPGVDIVSMGFEYFLQERDRFIARYNKKNQILFISQRNVGQNLSRIAVKISEACKGVDDVKIIYKLHPGEFAGAKELYPDLFKRNNIEIITNEIPLYQLFAESKVQIGFNSTALYEGIGFGLKTYFTNDADGLIREMIASGIAELIDENVDEQDILKSLHDYCDNCIDESLVSKLWRFNARENVMNYLKEKDFV